MHKAPVKYLYIFFFAFLWFPCICLSRLFVNKHTLDQVILGIQLGTWLALFVHFCLRDWLWDHIDRIASTSPAEVEKFPRLAINATLFFSLLYLFWCSLILGLDTYYETPQKWL